MMKPFLSTGSKLFFNGVYKLTRWILGAIFVYAGLIKLTAPATFAVLMDAFGIVPEPLLMPLSILIPVVEVAAGIGIFLDIKGSLPVYTVLLGMFIAILGYAVWLGLDIDCGCFGPEDPEAKAFHGLKTSLFRDMIMLAGLGFIYGWRKYRGIEPVKINVLINKIPMTKKENI